jgi:hypothetical protein
LYQELQPSVFSRAVLTFRTDRDYEQNEHSSLPRIKRSLGYLTKFFRGCRAININGATASEYAVIRRKQPREEGSRDGISTAAAIATVNRELAALRRMFNLGKKNGKVKFAALIEQRKPAGT